MKQNCNYLEKLWQPDLALFPTLMPRGQTSMSHILWYRAENHSDIPKMMMGSETP